LRPSALPLQGFHRLYRPRGPQQTRTRRRSRGASRSLAAEVRSSVAKLCAAKLLGGEIRRVIITLGANGSLLAERGGSEHVPPFTVKSIDSTGAGDAFIGSFAVFLAEGVSEREAVRRANLYAGLSTTGIGTQKSFYDRAL